MDSNLYNEILSWTILFPLDKEFRKKYNIPYGSKQHLETSQLDVLFDMYEAIAFEEYREKIRKEKEREEAISEGFWLNPKEISEEESDDFFKTPF